MIHKTTILGLIALISGVSVSAAPWWDDFPRMVDTRLPTTVSNYHGNFAMSGYGNDPTWGTFFQANGISNEANFEVFQNAGMKHIYYSETYGTTTAIVSELGAWDETNLTPILHHHWWWQYYGGGTIRW